MASLLRTDATTGAAILEELLDARLVDGRGRDQAGQQRYRLHDVTRLFARECRNATIDAETWTAALRQAADGWLALARIARERLPGEPYHLDDGATQTERSNDLDGLEGRDPAALRVAGERPVDWFEAEREALVGVVSACAEAGLAATARGLAGCATDFYALRAYYDDWRRTTEAALAACQRTGDGRGAAAMLSGLGSCLVDSGTLDEALTTLQAARTLAVEVGDSAQAAITRRQIGFVLSLSGALDAAESETRGAADELAAAGLAVTHALAVATLSFLQRQRGNHAEAIRLSQAALALARSSGSDFAKAVTSRNLASALAAAGRARESERAARRAAVPFEKIGDPIGAGQSLRVLGEAIAADPRRSAEAEQALGQAEERFREHGFDWGVALAELSRGEVEMRRGASDATARLERSLAYWTDSRVPALQARALVALADAAERAGDPSARELLIRAQKLYQELDPVRAGDLAQRLGRPAQVVPPT